MLERCNAGTNLSWQCFRLTAEVSDIASDRYPSHSQRRAEIRESRFGTISGRSAVFSPDIAIRSKEEPHLCF